MFIRTILGSTSLTTALFSSLAIAQSDVWSGLARSQFDSTALTLRIPCAVVEDESSNEVAGLAPAYALNLLLSSTDPGNERFQLVEPIAEFAEIPESCLDTLTVSNDGSTATYTTSSTEIDVDAAAFADRFYTLELQANLLAEGPVEFSIISAESRDYRKPIYTGDFLDGFIGVGSTDFIYDDDFLDFVNTSWEQGLVVFESGRVENNCFYDDPNNLLEVIEVVGTNVRYRLKSTVSAADNGKNLFATCTAFNRDINRLERTLQLVTWTVSL
ncbi:MAG: hypothetical protein GKR91_08345 [Pseudomonadales bacterium]|nr:hypothetical protein [Pseudomonadales bacterium]